MTAFLARLTTVVPNLEKGWEYEDAHLTGLIYEVLPFPQLIPFNHHLFLTAEGIPLDFCSQ